MATIHKGSCHCGAVEFEVSTEQDLGDLRRCNCSLCKRKGAIMAFAPLSALTVTRGADQLSLYQWNTQTAKHYFCSVCGIYTHHQRRMDPNQYGFNVACIDGIDPLSLEDVGLVDGAGQSLVQDA